MNVKLFKNHSEYSDMIEKPRVSHCIQDNEVHYGRPNVVIIDPGWSDVVEDPREKWGGNMS